MSQIRRRMAETINYEPITINHEPRTMNNVPRDMRYAIRDTQYAIRAPSLYICRERSTNQPFYAKQTQFPKSQMNVSIYLQTEYENKCNWTIGQSKPNSKPIKPNLRKAQMNENLFATKDYEEKCG